MQLSCYAREHRSAAAISPPVTRFKCQTAISQPFCICVFVFVLVFYPLIIPPCSDIVSAKLQQIECLKPQGGVKMPQYPVLTELSGKDTNNSVSCLIGREKAFTPKDRNMSRNPWCSLRSVSSLTSDEIRHLYILVSPALVNVYHDLDRAGAQHASGCLMWQGKRSLAEHVIIP
jgi:hypothetical protein